MSSAFLAAILVPIGVFAIALPGVLTVTLLYPHHPLRWRWITGSTLGLALSAYGSFLVSYLDIRLFAPLWIVLIAICALAWTRVPKPDRPRLFSRPSPTTWMLLTLLIVVGLLRAGIVAGRVVPKGWDATFHMILTQKILLSHRIITDWTPFEAISLNYPLASHTLLAAIASVTGLQPHLVFNLLLPLLGVFATAEVYALAAAASRRTTIGIFAAATYAFLAVVGSIDYVRWGGLPNALAMVLFLAVLRLLIGRDFPRRQWLLAVLIAGLIVTHHHVMAAACAVLAVLAAVAFFRRQRDLSRTILIAGALGSALAMPQVAPYLLKAGHLGATAVLHYETQPSIQEWVILIGWVFCLLTLAGALWYVRQRFTRALRTPGQIRIHWIIPVSAALLLALFTLTGIVYPLIRSYQGAQPLGAFTPSRFIHDAVPIVAVFAGCALYAPIRARWLKPWPALILCMLGTLSVLYAWKGMLQEDWPIGRCETYRWISANTPPQSLVLTRDCWGPYFSWRKTLAVPIPISEPKSFWEDRQTLAEYLNLVLNRKVSAPVDLVILRTREPGETAAAPTIWQHPEGFAVEQLWPPLLPPAATPAATPPAAMPAVQR